MFTTIARTRRFFFFSVTTYRYNVHIYDIPKGWTEIAY